MSPPIDGILHVFVAFDWGEEIRLEQAAALVPASRHELPRRRRTPSSFSYRPAPLHLPLEPVALELVELGSVQASAEVTIFDFAAVSLDLSLPFQLAADQLTHLADSLADPRNLVNKAREVLAPLHRQLLPAIVEPLWQDELSEEYFVFQLPPERVDVEQDAAWLAGLVHLEGAPLSATEVQEALRHQLRYSPRDVFVPDWGAAVLADENCEETLQVIEFANMQLLEFRHIDNRLDASLAAAARTVTPLRRSLFPFWRRYARPLWQLGELKVEATSLFERTGNVLKLVGDTYLARVYRLLAARFHLETWEQNIQRKLDVAQGIYEVVADQATHLRSELLELIIVLLIVLEIFLAFIRH